MILIIVGLIWRSWLTAPVDLATYEQQHEARNGKQSKDHSVSQLEDWYLARQRFDLCIEKHKRHSIKWWAIQIDKLEKSRAHSNKQSRLIPLCP